MEMGRCYKSVVLVLVFQKAGCMTVTSHPGGGVVSESERTVLLTPRAQCLDLGICHTASRIQALACKSPEPFALSTQPCRDGQQGFLEVGLPARLQGVSPPLLSHTRVLGLRMSQAPLAHPPQGSPGLELSRQPGHPLWWLPGKASAPGRQLNSPSFCLHPPVS